MDIASVYLGGDRSDKSANGVGSADSSPIGSDCGPDAEPVDCVSDMVRASVTQSASCRDRYRLCSKDLQVKISDFNSRPRTAFCRTFEE